uniref:Uncharacterized protein n=1 Tax=Rhizobium phage LG08 TaxID=3129229 RepID=A0AAU8HXT4_9CAUD
MFTLWIESYPECNKNHLTRETSSCKTIIAFDEDRNVLEEFIKSNDPSDFDYLTSADENPEIPSNWLITEF